MTDIRDRALEFVDKQNPFVAGSPQIIMRKHWLCDFMADFAAQERKDAAIEAARTALTKCANEMGLPVSAFPFSEVFSEMFPGESIEEK
jgi:hypothetical protein